MKQKLIDFCKRNPDLTTAILMFAAGYISCFLLFLPSLLYALKIWG